MAGRQKKAADWAEAKRRCRLNDGDIAMAKALRMSPRGLIANIPGGSQRWKAPVREWIHHLHGKTFGKSPATRPPPGDPPPRPPAAGPGARPAPIPDDFEPPF